MVASPGFILSYQRSRGDTPVNLINLPNLNIRPHYQNAISTATTVSEYAYRQHAFNAYRLDQFIISRFYSILLLSIGSHRCPNHAIGPRALNFYLYFAFIAIMPRYYRYLLAAQVEHTCLQYSREDINNFWENVWRSEHTRGLVIIDKTLKEFFSHYYKIWKCCRMYWTYLRMCKKNFNFDKNFIWGYRYEH